MCSGELSSGYDARFVPVYLAGQVHRSFITRKYVGNTIVIMRITRSICVGNGMRRYYMGITSRVSLAANRRGDRRFRECRRFKSGPRAIYRVTISAESGAHTRRHVRRGSAAACVCMCGRAASRSTSFSRPTVTLFILL